MWAASALLISTLMAPQQVFMSRPVVAAGGGGAVTLVGSDGGEDGPNTNDINITLPSHQTDDFGVITAGARSQGTNTTLSIGTASGWTLYVQEDHSDGAPDREVWTWYKKFTSGSETDPVLQSSGANQARCTILTVWRGVDTTTPFDASYQHGQGQNSINPTNPAITTVTDSSAVLLFHFSNNDDISSSGAPSGYTLSGEEIVGAGFFDRQCQLAYVEDAGSAGTKTPGAWTNSGSDGTQDYSLVTMALRPQ